MTKSFWRHAQHIFASVLIQYFVMGLDPTQNPELFQITNNR